jgi:hypothetical protein
MLNLYKHTTLYSEQDSEYIRIHTISFLYKKPCLFYNNVELNATVHSTIYGTNVTFNDVDQLKNTIDVVSFYKLNQLYNFDPSIRVSLTSTLLHTTKSIEDIWSLSDALIIIYKSKIINRTRDEIHFRIFNKCSITLFIIRIDEGYLIELLHNQINLYKNEFKKFTSDYCELIKEN